MSLLYIYAHAVGQEVDILTEKREGGGWKQKYIDKERICVREIKRMD